MNGRIKCLIVDDEPLAIKLIQAHIEKVPQLELVGSCENAIQALEELKHKAVDLLFLDIQMPVLTGIEFVRSLRQAPAVIFTTAYREYAVESYELEVVDYLLKPITFTRFFKAITKYLNTRQPEVSKAAPQEEYSAPAEEFIFVNANKKHIKVWFGEILYIESIKDYIRIHSQDTSVVTKEKISEFAQKLPDQFLRVHRSFIVNTRKITAYTAHDIEIGPKEIPIGGSYKQQVFDKLG